jgi:hypothetical protein
MNVWPSGRAEQCYALLSIAGTLGSVYRRMEGIFNNLPRCEGLPPSPPARDQPAPIARELPPSRAEVPHTFVRRNPPCPTPSVKTTNPRRVVGRPGTRRAGPADQPGGPLPAAGPFRLRSCLAEPIGCQRQPSSDGNHCPARYLPLPLLEPTNSGPAGQMPEFQRANQLLIWLLCFGL